VGVYVGIYAGGCQGTKKRPSETEGASSALALSYSEVLDLGPVNSMNVAAKTGNKITERNAGAPTIADAMIAAAQRIEFEMLNFERFFISDSLSNIG
jgi:hypothetical protein